jgi:DNA-binding transcriptional ArsR family regulator
MTALADDELWSAIGDPSRRQVLDLLVSNGDVSASWLAGRVPFSRQAVAKHLAVLEQAGLVSRRKQGREVLYQVQAGRLDQAARAMADLAAQWDRRLGTIKRLAEAAHAQAKKAKPQHPRPTRHDADMKERNNDRSQDRNPARVACRPAGAARGREGADPA